MDGMTCMCHRMASVPQRSCLDLPLDVRKCARECTAPHLFPEEIFAMLGFLATPRHSHFKRPLPRIVAGSRAATRGPSERQRFGGEGSGEGACVAQTATLRTLPKDPLTPPSPPFCRRAEAMSDGPSIARRQNEGEGARFELQGPSIMRCGTRFPTRRTKMYCSPFLPLRRSRLSAAPRRSHFQCRPRESSPSATRGGSRSSDRQRFGG